MNFPVENLNWKDSDISKTSNLLVSKSLGWWWLGGWSYDYNISRSPNLSNERLTTFDLDLDLGLTIIVFFEKSLLEFDFEPILLCSRLHSSISSKSPCKSIYTVITCILFKQ